MKTLILTGLLFIGIAGSAEAAAYLKLDGVKGESSAQTEASTQTAPARATSSASVSLEISAQNASTSGKGSGEMGGAGDITVGGDAS